MIEVAGLRKHYGGRVALEGLDLHVAPGEVLGLLGPNGSGKTTTMRLLMGLLWPSAGRASIGGLDCHADAVAVKRLVGYLPDEPYLHPYLTGLELLELVGGLHGLAGTEARGRARELGERFVGEEVGRLIHGYSHGARKRLALAAALVHGPRALLLDEPTNGLDPRAARLVHDTVRALAADGAAVLLSTHLLDSAARLCDRVAVLHRGRLRALGALSELCAGPGGATRSLEEVYLTATEEAPAAEARRG